MLKLINHARSKGTMCGTVEKSPVSPLKLNDQLTKSAQNHSLDMANKNYFSHDSLDGRKFDRRIINEGYNYRTAGENIAAGYNTPEEVMNGFLSSPGHCENIMNSSFKEVGIGYAYNQYSKYKTFWTQDFGS